MIPHPFRPPVGAYVQASVNAWLQRKIGRGLLNLHYWKLNVAAWDDQQRRLERGAWSETNAYYQTPEAAVERWHTYARLANGPRNHWHIAQEQMLDLLTHLPSPPTRLVNIGSCYGWLEAQLAERFPQAQIIGWDVQEAVQALNRSTFPRRNLVYHGGDLASVITPGVDVLLHSRTAEGLPPHVVQGWYALAQIAKVKTIGLLEANGYSRRHPRWYYSPRETTSELYDGTLWLHPYPTLLQQFGYLVVYDQLQPAGIQGRPDSHLYGALAGRENPNR